MSDPTTILVIFDLDFTLIDNSYAICQAFIHALQQFSVTPPKVEYIIAKIGIPLKEMFLEYLSAEKAQKAVTYFREHYASHFFENLTCISGAIDLLNDLRDLGYRIALLTSKKTEFAKKLLHHIKMDHYFAYVLGEQEDIAPKPSPASIKFIVAQFSGIQKVYMIGDHVVDCLASKRAGIGFIGVLSGNTPEADLRACAGEASVILETVRDIIPQIHLK